MKIAAALVAWRNELWTRPCSRRNAARLAATTALSMEPGCEAASPWAATSSSSAWSRRPSPIRARPYDADGAPQLGSHRRAVPRARRRRARIRRPVAGTASAGARSGAPPPAGPHGSGSRPRRRAGSSAGLRGCRPAPCRRLDKTARGPWVSPSTSRRRASSSSCQTGSPTSAQQVVDGADVGAALAEEGVVEAQQRHPDLLGDRGRRRGPASPAPPRPGRSDPGRGRPRPPGAWPRSRRRCRWRPGPSVRSARSRAGPAPPGRRPPAVRGCPRRRPGAARPGAACPPGGGRPTPRPAPGPAHARGAR